MKPKQLKTKTGLQKEHFRNGELASAGKTLQVGKFQDGKQVGLWKRYHASGELYDMGRFVDGKKTGVWKYFDSKGNLIRTKKH